MDVSYNIDSDPRGYAQFYGYTSDATDGLAHVLEVHASRQWDIFYKRHKSGFFKDRHWIRREFPEILIATKSKVLEVGCGAGNTVFPLLELRPDLRICCCDFSRNAVTLVVLSDSDRSNNTRFTLSSDVVPSSVIS